MLSLQSTRHLARASTAHPQHAFALRTSNIRFTSVTARYRNNERAEAHQRRTDAANGPANDDTDYSSSDSARGPLDKPIFAHSAGGPLGGLVEKTKELQQRYKDTPGDSTKQRCACVQQQQLHSRVCTAGSQPTAVLLPSYPLSCHSPPTKLHLGHEIELSVYSCAFAGLSAGTMSAAVSMLPMPHAWSGQMQELPSCGSSSSRFVANSITVSNRTTKEVGA